MDRDAKAAERAGGRSSIGILADKAGVTTAVKNSRSICFASAAFALGQAVQVNNGVVAPAAIAWVTLAIVLVIYRNRKSIDLDQVDLMRG